MASDVEQDLLTVLSPAIQRQRLTPQEYAVDSQRRWAVGLVLATAVAEQVESGALTTPEAVGIEAAIANSIFAVTKFHGQLTPSDLAIGAMSQA